MNAVAAVQVCSDDSKHLLVDTTAKTKESSNCGKTDMDGAPNKNA